MGVLSTTDWNEVMLIWLRSEWYKLKAAQSSRRQLIDHPDLTNETENVERLSFLLDERRPIIYPLPKDVLPKLVYGQESDLPKLYLVPTYECMSGIRIQGVRSA
jgi:hypothetical protein